MAFAHRYNKGCGVGNEKDWTPPGFSRWYFNFGASQDEEEQPRHHQALAGGTSTSELVKRRRNKREITNWCCQKEFGLLL